MHPKAREIAEKIVADRWKAFSPDEAAVVSTLKASIAAAIDAALKAERRESLYAACRAVCPMCRDDWPMVDDKFPARHVQRTTCRSYLCDAARIHKLMANEE